jgi:putative ABC transport system substrate-binding protein
MKRREFVTLLGGATMAWPLVARAQQAAMPVVGYLGSETPELFATRLAAFRQGLSSTGYDEGRNVTIVYRWAEGHNDRLPGLAADLVRRRVDVIAAPGSIAAALAAKAATGTIPVVFETGADPVTTGLVASLNKPAGNVTGVSSLNAEVGPKRLELLYELGPGAVGFALLVNPSNPVNADATAKSITTAAETLKLQLHLLKAGTEAELASAVARARELHLGGLVIGSDTFYANRSQELARLVIRYRIPAVHQSREFAATGGLMGYGGSIKQSHSQAGVYTGRVLKGEKPADLPIQQVTKVEFVFNLKAAKALGLNPSSSFLARADEVIE